MYRIWGAGVIMHSDVYNKLHTEDPDEGWSSGDSRDRDRGSEEKSDLTGASALADGGEVECVNINNVRSSDISGDEEGDGGEEEKLLAFRSSSVNKKNSNSSANISLGPLCSHDQYSPCIRSRGRSGSVNSKSDRELGSVERRRGSGKEEGDNFCQSSRLHSTVQSENASTSAQMFGGNFKGKFESSNCESSGSGSSNDNGKRRKGIRSTGESYARYYECSSESGTNTDISPNRCRVRDEKIERERERDRDAESSVTHRPQIPGYYNNESRTVDINHRSSRNRCIKSPSSKNNSRSSSPDSRHSYLKSSSTNRRASDSCNFNSIVNYHLTCATPTVPVSTSPSISTSTSLISLTVLTCPSATATREVGGSNLLSDDFSTNRRTGHDDSCSDMSDTNDVNFRKEYNDSHHEWGKGKRVPNLESSHRRASVTGTGARQDIEMGALNLSPSKGTNHMKSPLSTAAVNGSRVDLPQSPPLRQKISPPRNTYPSDSERDRDRDRASSQSDDSSYKVRDHNKESEISIPKQFDLLLEETYDSAFSQNSNLSKY